MSVETDVRDLHAALGIHSQGVPGWSPEAIIELRKTLIREEAEEALAALADHEPLEDVAKELCDVVVVAVGAAVALGIPFDECWRRVHDSNMAKAGGPVREDGKILKPPGWRPPDLRSALYPLSSDAGSAP